MAEGSSTLLLMAWLSPAFPIGSFSYSHGLERAVEDKRITSAGDLQNWIDGLLRHGSAWNDAVLVAETWRRARSGGDLGDIAELGEAMAGSAERHLETMAQGAAFAKAVDGWIIGSALPDPCPYQVMFGAAAGLNAIDLDAALAAYLQAFVSNQIQAGIRLSVLGQGDGLSVLRTLEPAIRETAGRAAASTLDDLGSATLLAEIAAITHETQYSRLFRS